MYKFVPDLEPFCGSWIVVNRETGLPVIEIFSRCIAEKINFQRYEVFTAYQWLVKFNSQIKK